MSTWNNNGKGLIWKVYGGFTSTNAYVDAPVKLNFNREEDRLLQKVAVFDLDGTLVSPASGNVHPTNEKDWQWLSNVRLQLRTLVKHGFAIAMVSNQGSKNPAKIEQFKARVDLISADIDIPFFAMAGLDHSSYRKPQTGMWDFYQSTFLIKPDPASFFVGDAAGRAKDVNDTDRTFALNCGLQFYTPEEYFCDAAPEPFTLKITFSELQEERPTFVAPSSSLRSKSAQNVYGSDAFPSVAKDGKKTTTEQELVVCVGAPGSGKSTYVKTQIEPLGYSVVNPDSLKTKHACITAVFKALKDGKSVVVDSANPSKECRKVYINAARAQNIKTRILRFDTPLVVCRHNNAYSRYVSRIKERVSDSVYDTYKKNYEEPTSAEGDVLNISFKIDTRFSDYQKYYV